MLQSEDHEVPGQWAVHSSNRVSLCQKGPSNLIQKLVLRKGIAMIIYLFKHLRIDLSFV